MVDVPKSLKELREVNRRPSPNEHISRWKEQGGKVIGWTCAYVPLEIIDAAGALPVRIVQDSKEMELGDADGYLSTSCCSFARTLLQRALDKQMDFLDGIVLIPSCDSMRRLKDTWQRYVPIPIVDTLIVPRKADDAGIQLYTNRIVNLKKRIEEFTGASVSDEALEESIKAYNRVRQLLGELYDLRKRDKPPISGAEVMEVLNAGNWMSCRDFEVSLQKLLEELEVGGRELESSARLMVVGCVLNSVDFLNTIEKAGGLIVMDDLCTGSKQWMEMVRTENGRPILENIARRYLDKPSCARQVPLSSRIDHALRLAKEYRVDAVINQQIRYCVDYGFDRPVMRESFNDSGIPVLELDKEYGTQGTGPIVTRVQAFMEMLAGREVKADRS